VVTTNSNALLLITSPQAETTNHEIRFDDGTLTGGVGYQYCFYADASNHVYIKWTSASGVTATWEVHEVIGGVDTTLASGSCNVSQSDCYEILTTRLTCYAIRIALFDNELCVYIADDVTRRWYTLTVSDPDALGLYYGFGTGAADRWRIVQNPVLYKEHAYCWTKWPAVIRDTLPSQLQIVVTGAQNYTGGTCNHCADELDQTFILDPLTKANFANTMWPPGYNDPVCEFPGYYRYIFDEANCYTYPLTRFGYPDGHYYWQWEFPETPTTRLTQNYIGRLRLYSDEGISPAYPIRGQWELEVPGFNTCDVFDAAGALATPRTLVYQTAGGTGVLFNDLLCDVSQLTITVQAIP